MRKFVLQTLSLAVGASLAAQGQIVPLAPNNAPELGAGTINSSTVSGEIVQSIDQIELRSLGGGAYRCTATAEMVGQNDSKIITGTLILSGTPTWIPSNDVEALNVAGTATDEFQGSISLDGLTYVWDNYQGATYPSATGTTFICHRLSTAVPFAVADVRAIAGVPGGGVDPHIGGELASGDIVLYFLDVNGDISKMNVNPLTGATSAQTLAVAGGGNAAGQTPGTVNFSHSSFVQRDSAGNARGLTWSEFIGSGSDGLWTEGVNNDGTPLCIAKRDLGGAAYWFANPAVVGGTIAWATATGGYGDPSKFGGNMVCNTDLRPGNAIIPVYAPIEPNPVAPGVSRFISVVAIGSSAPPYQVPPVQGDILLFPTVGVLDIKFHANDTGYAQYTFGAVPVLNVAFDMQIITLDTSTSSIYAGNVARLDM